MKINNKFFLFIMIGMGLLLRLIWTHDMEWKEDEKDMYRMAHEAVASGTLPVVGMRSGGGPVNPGLSVAPFAFFAMFTNNPPEMNQMVQVVNVLSVLFFLGFILLKIKSPDREIWLAGLSLAAVSPLAVLFSRKIWAQDMLPMISFLILFSHFHRHRRWGAFVWGLTGALVGQIHMSGFFLAAGIFVFTLLHDHFNKRPFKWRFWLSGSVIGSIPLYFWIMYMLEHPQISRQSFWHIFQFNFFIHWFIDSLGINMYYSLREHFWEYLREPVFFGFPSGLVLLAHIFLVGVAILALIRIVKIGKSIYQKIKQGLSPGAFFQDMGITHFYLYALLLGLGVFMTLSGVTIHPHYLICAFPFQYIFLAKLFEDKKALFNWIIVAQLLITLGFLLYIHTHHGAPSGDYGTSYNAQVF